MYLTSEVRRLNKELGKQKNPLKNAQILQNNLKKLEDKVMYERNINIQSIAKLKAENKQLTTQVRPDLKTVLLIYSCLRKLK